MVTQVSKRHPASPKQAASCCTPMDELLDPDLFKALCDPTRIRLLGCLIKCARACSVSEIAECCDVDFSVVSRHLRLLERAGVLESNKEGRVVQYRVDAASLCRSLRGLADAIDACGSGGAGCGCCAPASPPPRASTSRVRAPARRAL